MKDVSEICRLGAFSKSEKAISHPRRVSPHAYVVSCVSCDCNFPGRKNVKDMVGVARDLVPAAHPKP